MKKPPPNATTWTAVGLIALGLIMIYLAWNGAAGGEAARDLRAQFPYLLSGGVFGLALIGAGLTLVRVYEARKDAKEIVGQLQRLTDAVERMAAARTVDDHVDDHEGVPRSARTASGMPTAAGRGGLVRTASITVQPAPSLASGVPPLAPPPPFERGR